MSVAGANSLFYMLRPRGVAATVLRTPPPSRNKGLHPFDSGHTPCVQLDKLQRAFLIFNVTAPHL